MGKSTYIPSAEDRRWSKNLAEQIKRCNKQVLRKQKVRKTYAQIAAEGIEPITEEEEPTVEIPSEELNKINQDWNRIIPEEPLSTSPEPESPAESSSAAQNRTPQYPP